MMTYLLQLGDCKHISAAAQKLYHFVILELKYRIFKSESCAITLLMMAG